MAVQLHDDYPVNTREGNTCSACHAGHQQIRDPGERIPRPERVVDFFINIDFEGFLMLCERCVLEAATLLGWVAPADRDVAIDAAAELLVEVRRLTAERDELEALLRTIRNYDRAHPAPEVEVIKAIITGPENEPEAPAKPAAKRSHKAKAPAAKIPA